MKQLCDYRQKDTYLSRGMMWRIGGNKVLEIAAVARSDSPSSSESAGCHSCFLSIMEGFFGLNKDDCSRNSIHVQAKTSKKEVKPENSLTLWWRTMPGADEGPYIIKLQKLCRGMQKLGVDVTDYCRRTNFCKEKCFFSDYGRLRPKLKVPKSCEGAIPAETNM